MFYSLLGERAHSCKELLGSRNGQARAHNISITLLADMLCMFDAREAFVIEHNMYPMESQLGSDPCENVFGEIAAVCGFNPTAKLARESLQKIEDELACRINPRNRMKERKKRKRRHTQVRKMPSWPRSWANVSPLQLYQLYFHPNAWANLHLPGQTNTCLVEADTDAATGRVELGSAVSMVVAAPCLGAV